MVVPIVIFPFTKDMYLWWFSSIITFVIAFLCEIFYFSSSWNTCYEYFMSENNFGISFLSTIMLLWLNSFQFSPLLYHHHGHRGGSQQVVQFSSLEGAAICFCCDLPLQITLSDSSSNYRTTCHTCESESKRMNHKISRKTVQFFPC